ncbi:lipid A deacylase LpxR family protein [Psychromonas aquimarina]|uniref:lipid A deacylase LpxR family protein n=1 Tax=Psychromonas aquimarina TaxID=444919 RepID=UPI00041F5F3A|nr:lipid A deacylase LpxR family protein [Psychromonas aquimarina]
MSHLSAKRVIHISALLLCTSDVYAGQWFMQIDNDAAFGDDGNYSSGLTIGWENTPAPTLNKAPGFMRRQSLFSFTQTETEQTWGLKLTQQMWTPAEIAIEAPQPYDRPFAGYLAVESHTAAYSSSLAQKNWLSLGVVGPASGTQEVQEVVHEIIGSSSPLGWHNQIENQLTVQLGYEVETLLFRQDFASGSQWELSGFSHSQLGNFRSETDLGLTLRWGTNLPNSFGRLSSHSGQYGNLSATTESGSFFLYSRAYIGYRFNDLTLQGSLPYDSYVELENKQAALVVGVIWAHPGWSVAWSFNTYTREYQSDPGRHHGYGSLIFSWGM